MIGKLGGHDDTIVAIATAPGLGAIAVIRLSGKEAIRIADACFKGKKLAEQPSHTLHFGIFHQNDKMIDEVVMGLYRAPKSYTGEEVVEISCHGSPYIQQLILEACIEAGARMAKPGEFTQRAFLNGKLDLTQAESVADLIASNTEASRQTALQQMRGGFSKELQALREDLIKFSALIELELDFSEEDVEFADRTALYTLVNSAIDEVSKLVSSFRVGNVIKNGVSTAIIGRPNAGKSTLLNHLLNENRAIVSDIAGTTRDTIEEILNIDGILFRLIDTAGIRESTDVIEQIGVEKSLSKMREAGIVLYLFDVRELSSEELRRQQEEFASEGIQALLVGNKTDLMGMEASRQKFAEFPEILFISAKSDIGDLKKRLVDQVIGGNINTENTIITNVRHYTALQEVLKALGDVQAAMDARLTGDLVALDIRRCLYFLGEIAGEVSNEDRLDYIFSKFCIGK
jgi:tRNA modification GTPase